MQFSYTTSGTCSRQIDITVEEDVITDVKFIKGCSGNTQAVSALVRGMKVHDAISRLKGIACQGDTSCPDQLARALESLAGQ